MLILGSFPSAASLAAQRYYAHPQNQFWRILGAVIEQPLKEMDYPARLAAVQAAGIAIWDASVARSPGVPGGPDRPAVAVSASGYTACRVGNTSTSGASMPWRPRTRDASAVADALAVTITQRFAT